MIIITTHPVILFINEWLSKCFLLRRPIGAPGPSLDILSDQIQNIDLKNSFNINAVEFVPK